MPQDQDTGTQGDKFGRQMAPRIADAIGARMAGARSNEAHFKGRVVAIKCAGTGNDRVGVTFVMLDRLDGVIGAFQVSETDFEVFEMSAARFRECMIPTRSTGASAGKVGIATKSDFRRQGISLGVVQPAAMPARPSGPAINYRVVHERTPWRKVGQHDSLQSALQGELGAHNLLLRRGRVAERWVDYGDVKCVFVWASGDEVGYALRLSPTREGTVEQVKVPTALLAQFEAAKSCSDEDIDACFRGGIPSVGGPKASNALYPEELRGGPYSEGTAMQVTVNRYERDPAAREACIRHHGALCQVCGLDFGKRYGELGKGFIHVHHLVPLSSVGAKHTPDPKRDLVPVCPNCHAMLHRTEPPMSPDALKRVLT